MQKPRPEQPLKPIEGLSINRIFDENDSEARTTARKQTAGATPAGWRQLDNLPVGLFGSVMGLAGLSGAWSLAHAQYGAPRWIADSIGVLAVIAFVLVALGYAAKAAIAPAAVRAEFKHPIAGNLFGTIFISLLLLPMVLAPVNLLLAQVMWSIGAILMMGFAWLIVDRWMSDRQQVAHATPAWIVPVVGLLDVPLALPALGLPSLHGLMLLALSVGLFFAIPLFTMIFSRLVFEAPMPDALKPTLLIVVAPFAVGCTTYDITTGQFDVFAQALAMLTLFMLAVLVGQLRYLPGCCPFRISWWAVSFPLAAAASTALRYAEAVPGRIADGVALALLAFATLVIIWLLARTLFGIARGELRTLSS